MTASSVCGISDNANGFCAYSGTPIYFDKTNDADFSYKVEYSNAKGKDALKFKKWNFCRKSFVLPSAYAGGLGVLVEELPGKMKTLMSVDGEYFND